MFNSNEICSAFVCYITQIYDLGAFLQMKAKYNKLTPPKRVATAFTIITRKIYKVADEGYVYTICLSKAIMKFTPIFKL